MRGSGEADFKPGSRGSVVSALDFQTLILSSIPVEVEFSFFLSSAWVPITLIAYQGFCKIHSRSNERRDSCYHLSAMHMYISQTTTHTCVHACMSYQQTQQALWRHCKYACLWLVHVVYASQCGCVYSCTHLLTNSCMLEHMFYVITSTCRYMCTCNNAWLAVFIPQPFWIALIPYVKGFCLNDWFLSHPHLWCSVCTLLCTSSFHVHIYSCSVSVLFDMLVWNYICTSVAYM